jgi:hypothetical protein
MAHIVSNTQPPNGALGDEWFNPTTNKLSKLVALSGTTVSWQDVGNIVTGTSTAVVATPAASSGGLSASTDNIFTARQNFVGNTAATAIRIFNATEQMVVSGTILGSSGNSTVQIDVANSAVYYFTSIPVSNWTINFRMSPSASLNSAMANNESVSTVVMVTQGTTAYYANLTQIDGTAVIPKWQDALAPTSGNASSVDIYNYNIIKTANGTFTVLGSQSRFA